MTSLSRRRLSRSITLGVCLAVAGRAAVAVMPGAGIADPELAREPSWRIPPVEEVRDRALAWLAAAEPAGQSSTAATRARAAWEATNGRPRVDVLDAVMETVICGEPRAEAIRPAAAGDPDLSWLDDPATTPFVRDAVKLWWGRELVRRDRFDDAMPLLVGLDVAAAVDPATLLFHRAACQHWLLAVDDALESLDRLLEREDEIPVRYARVARLLRVDMAALDRDSLDHIARRMRDVTRRLDLGRAGAATRDVQDGVIESLDKLIEQLQDQQQQQGGGGAAGAGGGPGQGAAGKPMEDSRPAGGRGPGDVQGRDLGVGDDWGRLPPHDRDQALQQIGREFPPHYREAIEQYFKRLASGVEDR